MKPRTLESCVWRSDRRPPCGCGPGIRPCRRSLRSCNWSLVCSLPANAGFSFAARFYVCATRRGNLWLPYVVVAVVCFDVLYFLLMKYVLQCMFEKKNLCGASKGFAALRVRTDVEESKGKKFDASCIRYTRRSCFIITPWIDKRHHIQGYGLVTDT